MRILATAAALLALASPAIAHDAFYVGTPSGAAESPPNASGGWGLVILTVNDDEVTMRVQVAFAALSGSVTSANVYCCTAAESSGTGGGVMGPAWLAGFPTGVTSGIYDQLFDMSLASNYDAAFMAASGGTPSAAFDAQQLGLIGGRAYLEIRSISFGDGEIRTFPGIISGEPPPFPPAGVPEAPSPWLLSLGLGVLALKLGRRR